MKRLLTLLILFFHLALGAQNLIADWSLENYSDCPLYSNGLEMYLPNWLSMRGTTDYFHSCCQAQQLCWNNSFGFQVPLTGNGYVGSVNYHTGLVNGREHFGVMLLDTMQIDESYHISFHVTMASRPNATQLACSNLGFLLMTENYLDSDPLGVLLNFSHFKLDTIHSDTLNWVQVATEFVADSAYKFIAFGNFYDDDNTQFSQPYTNETGGMIAYYYWDDFCVSTNGSLCNQVLSTGYREKTEPKIYPNPCGNKFAISSTGVIQEINILDITSQKMRYKAVSAGFNAEIELGSNLKPGMYIVQIRTEEGTFKKKLMVVN